MTNQKPKIRNIVFFSIFFGVAVLFSKVQAQVIVPYGGSNTNNIVNVAPVALPVTPPATVVKPASPAESTLDINSSDFKLVICDGPAGAPGVKIPCDFKGIMMQVQRLLNIAIIAGVLVAICGFSYAGYLHITGVPSNIEHARKIFSNVAIGFIIMLSAWFIVYQILSWLTGNSGFGVLLGTP